MTDNQNIIVGDDFEFMIQVLLNMKGRVKPNDEFIDVMLHLSPIKKLIFASWSDLIKHGKFNYNYEELKNTDQQN